MGWPVKSPKTLIQELHLIEAMLEDLHPTVHFSSTDMAVLVGAAQTLRWALGDRKSQRVTRMVRPKRRKVRRNAH